MSNAEVNEGVIRDFTDEEDDGPIVLPPGAACKGCAYSDVIRVQGNIQSVRICRRMPPSAYFIMDGRGGGAVMSSPPQVPDDFVCFEYDEKVTPNLIPTGLG